jgi:PPOX class probable F420-dependent enzyme
MSGLDDRRAALDVPASHRDLLATAGVAALATIGADGQPQVTAVSYLLDDDGRLKVSVREDRQKAKNMAARPQATLFLIDVTDSQRTVEVRATVEVVPDEGGAFARRLYTHYGIDPTRLDDEREERFVVTLHPRRVNVRPAQVTANEGGRGLD